MWSSEPNAGHRALVDLERSGRLDTLVTQNIDGLHQKAGTDPDRVVEIHGTALDVVCLHCGDRQPAEPVHERVRAGEDDPACTVTLADGAACGGILKSATISFGQNLVAEDLFRAEAAAAACDLLLAVGSTLAVFPAAGLVPVAVRHGAVVIIVNGDPTEMDALADVVVHGPIGECLPALVEGLPRGRMTSARARSGPARPADSAATAPGVLGLAAGLQGEPPDAGDGPQRHGGRRHRLDDLPGTALGHGRRPYPARPARTVWSGMRTVTAPGRSGPKARAKMCSATQAGELNRCSAAARRNRSTCGNEAGSVARMAACMSVSTSPGDTA